MEKILEILYKIIKSHRPNYTENEVKGMAELVLNNCRDTITDTNKLKELSKKLIETPNLKVTAAVLTIEIKKYFGSQNSSTENSGNYSEFKPYLKALTGVILDTDFDIKRFSSYLANTQIVEYKTGDDRSVTRYLKRSEYDQVSSIRVANGNRPLLSYKNVKFEIGWEDQAIEDNIIDRITSGKVLKNVNDDNNIKYQSRQDARNFDRNGYTPDFKTDDDLVDYYMQKIG